MRASFEGNEKGGENVGGKLHLSVLLKVTMGGMASPAARGPGGAAPLHGHGERGCRGSGVVREVR
jgi:hypothetical protein